MNNPRSHASLTAQLLRGAADYMRSLKPMRPEISETLETDAQTCELVADRVEQDPQGDSPPLPALSAAIH